MTTPFSASACRFLTRSGCRGGGFALRRASGMQARSGGRGPAGEATGGGSDGAVTVGPAAASVPGPPTGTEGRGDSTAAAGRGGERELTEGSEGRATTA